MQILVSVDQAAALRQGIDAPSSTTHIEVDPATLSQEQRDYLASKLHDGHDARGIIVVRPDLYGLIAALQDRVNEARRAEAERLQRLRQAMEDVEEVEQPVHLGHHGEPVRHPADAIATRTIRVRKIRRLYGLRSTEVDRQYVALCSEIESEQDQRTNEALEDMRANEYREYLEEQEREAAERQAEYDRLYARIPESLRRRHQDGYAETDEVEEAIQRLMCGDASLRPADWDDSEKLDTLTEEQYQRLVEAREQAPEGAEVVPMLVWDGRRGYRPADPEEMDEADQDGEVWEDGSNVRHMAVITWSRGGVTATAGRPLD